MNSSQTQRLLITAGLVVDPARGQESFSDIAIADGRIVAVVPSGAAAAPASITGFEPNEVWDAKGCIVCPGLTDLHVHLGQLSPTSLRMQQEAAYTNGITTLVCSPSLNPVLDAPAWVDRLLHNSAEQGLARIHPLGALTMGLAGETLSDMGALREAGCMAMSQGDSPLPTPRVLLRAMQYAKTLDLALHLHPLDMLWGHGVAASGAVAIRLGLPHVPESAEILAVQTLLELMRHTGVRVHISRITSAQSVSLIAQGKQEGLRLSCDVSMHNLLLCDEALSTFDSRLHLIPMLRHATHQAALRQGLIDGTIDALVSDHTPITQEGKDLPFAQAQAGAWGMHYLLPAVVRLQEETQQPWAQVLSWVTTGPHRVLNGPSIHTSPESMPSWAVGPRTSLCIFDPQAPAHIPSTCARFSPFAPDLGLIAPLRGQIKSMWTSLSH
jgi:dihydroorotase